MKVVIVDDEKAMHLIMKRMLGKLDQVKIVGIFHDTAAAFSYLENHDADLIFVDINMPKESGLEFAVRLRESGRQTKLVFVTSHKEYALSAFDVYAYDYIVKPVLQERLHHTVQRALAEVQVEQALTLQEPSSIRIMFNCLGGMEIRSAQNVIVKWKSSKSAELFGYLLIQKGRQVSRARLIEDIFGDMPQKNAEIYLNTTVYQLRRLLDNYGLRDRLHSDNNHYALDLHQVRVDMVSFEEGCKEMTVVNQLNLDQAIELQQLYAGDLFGDRAFPWAWSEVERLSQLYSSFTQRLCTALLAKGDTQMAIRLLLKLFVRNELNEETFKLLMHALALKKDKEGLTQHYIKFTENMRKELGLSPSLEVAALYRRLLSKMESA